MVRLDAFLKLAARSAYLGHIDCGPFEANNNGEWKRIELWARKVQERHGIILAHLEGRSEVSSRVETNAPGMHDVNLTWEGFMEVRGERIVRLLLLAEGTESIEFAKNSHPLLAGGSEVSFLPGGRPIDRTCWVRYGIIGAPGNLDPFPSALRGSDSASIQAKMQRFGRIAERRQREGKDISGIVEIARRVEASLKQGNVREAENLLDEALSKCGS